MSAPRQRFCESVAGEWGELCPDCGQRLPEERPPLASWQASRPLREGVRWDGSPLEPGRERMSTAQRRRWTAPGTGRGRAPRLFMDDVATILRTTGGNVNAAAIALAVARQSILAFLHRNRADVPADVTALLDARRKPRRAGIAAATKVVAAMLAVLALAAPVAAAPRADAACSIADGVLRITGLPTRDAFSYSPDLYPIGTTLVSPDGTWATAWPYPTAYVWERGGGKTLIKVGPQLNDYHVIAWCVA